MLLLPIIFSFTQVTRALSQEGLVPNVTGVLEEEESSFLKLSGIKFIVCHLCLRANFTVATSCYGHPEPQILLTNYIQYW